MRNCILLKFNALYFLIMQTVRSSPFGLGPSWSLGFLIEQYSGGLNDNFWITSQLFSLFYTKQNQNMIKFCKEYRLPFKVNQ